MKFNECSKNEQWIILTMQKLGYGEINGLLVKGGQPQPVPMPELWRTEKFGVNAVPEEKISKDFELHRQHVYFLEYLGKLDNGTLSVIQIHNGLPLIHKRKVLLS